MSNHDISEDIYSRLADALEALPNGFARTPSGVELRLMALAFTPEEAWLASHLTRKYETVAEIANRVDLDEAKVKETLDSLVPKRLTVMDNAGRQAHNASSQVKGENKYRLGQFLVGWYEANMRRLDTKEFAELYEQFVIEGGQENGSYWATTAVRCP